MFATVSNISAPPKAHELKGLFLSLALLRGGRNVKSWPQQDSCKSLGGGAGEGSSFASSQPCE